MLNDRRDALRRVVITGLGAVTPIGLTVKEFWANLANGVSGVGPITLFDATSFPVRIAAEVKGFDARDYMDFKLAKRSSRPTQFALTAAQMALQDAALVIDKRNASSIGVVINTGGGGVGEIEDGTKVLIERGAKGISPFFVPTMMPNAVSCQVSIATGAKGPIITSTAACASANYAFVEAMHILRRGEAEVVIAGGTEAGITPLFLAAFASMKALSRRNEEPARASRPFDVDRDGFVMGEGAGVMILETLEHARRRGAWIYAEVVGGGFSGDAYHLTAPDPSSEGAIRAMRRALQDAQMEPEEIDHVSAHGTGTKLNTLTVLPSAPPNP
jgi:3-oxoacyl-[acyl-carrier-protein] synthase II